MSVDVGCRDLVRSYRHLRDESGRCVGDPRYLLLFYAVECGLKAAVLGKLGQNARSTADLPADLRSHDLRRLAKELKLPGAVVPAACRRRHDRSLTVSHEDVHQAWRYGACLNESDEVSFVAALGRLGDWCRGEHEQ